MMVEDYSKDILEKQPEELYNTNKEFMKIEDNVSSRYYVDLNYLFDTTYQKYIYGECDNGFLKNYDESKVKEYLSRTNDSDDHLFPDGWDKQLFDSIEYHDQFIMQSLPTKFTLYLKRLISENDQYREAFDEKKSLTINYFPYRLSTACKLHMTNHFNELFDVKTTLVNYNLAHINKKFFDMYDEFFVWDLDILVSGRCKYLFEEFELMDKKFRCPAISHKEYNPLINFKKHLIDVYKQMSIFCLFEFIPAEICSFVILNEKGEIDE